MILLPPPSTPVFSDFPPAFLPQLITANRNGRQSFAVVTVAQEYKLATERRESDQNQERLPAKKGAKDDGRT
uniref:HDC17470 n=1 Tax=Drosophila melanogaster TaxID=7227 RepID=Q6IIN8_DROME|nr:TPA_inf: HDC17470 [Drosophila melanogaster]